jgi:TonB-linked SusC/RagA family outer membrane protein
MKKLVKLFSLFFILTGLIGFAQGTVSGVVSDTEGMPLPGATVVVQGTSVGVTSDFDGNYSISASQGDVLVFSYVGYTSSTVTVGMSSTLNVTLESSTALEEVVVTGITTRDRKRMTSGSVVVGSELIEGVAVSSPDQALMGRVAGLRIVGVSGTPGAQQQIRIRGEGSLTGSNAPAFVIDGQLISSGSINGPTGLDMGVLSMINANDIESITVLKDAASLAAYGARGSNGVIVITTKKGTAGKVSYSVNSSYGFQNYAMDERPMLNGNQRLELAGETLMNSYGYTRERATDYVLNVFAGAAAWDEGGRVDGNWDELVKVEDAVYQKYDVSASGGSASDNFRISLGYTDQEGTSVGTNFESVTGSFAYTKKDRRITIQTSNRVANSIQEGQFEGGSYFAAPQMTRVFMSPWIQPKNADGSWNINPPTSIFNTLYLADNNINRNEATRAISNSSLTYQIMDGLKVSTTFGIDYINANVHQYESPEHGGGLSENGTSDMTNTRVFNWTTQNNINYDKTFGDNEHFLSVLLSQRYQKNKSLSNYSYGENVAAMGLIYPSSFQTNQASAGSFSDWTNLSYLALVNYSYLDKYILDLSFRNDGSSRFASDVRFGNFWSAGAAWNISSENFLADNKVISNLKLRASYGQSGNNAISLNQYQALFSYGGSYNDSGTVTPSSFANPIISWETANLTDVGIDLGLFSGRVTASVNYYVKETEDLLQSVPLSLTTGHSSYTMNVGTVRNQGIEIEFDADVVKAGDFTWNLYGNYATNDNEIMSLAQDANGEDINLDGGYNASRVGRSIGAWFLRTYGGVDASDGRPYWITGGDESPEEGYSEEVTYAMTSALQSWAGERIPTYSGGIGTRFSFKGLSVDANFYFTGGHKIYERWGWYSMQTGLLSTRYYQGDQRLLDRWQQPGDVTDVPKMIWSTSTTTSGSGNSTRFLYDGDFVRLRDLTVNYSLPKSLLGNSGLDGVNVFVKGLNLLTWTKDDLPIDPEIRTNGSWEIYTPILKSVSLGLNLKF